MPVNQIKSSIKQCVTCVNLLNNEQYCFSIKGSSSPGSHVRHMIDRMNCFVNNFSTGFIDYDLRDRDVNIEVNQSLSKVALNKINDLFESFDENYDDKILVTETLCEGSASINIKSTIGREIVDLINHNTHHLAIIKMILSDQVSFSDSFGKAASTVKYENNQLQKCAQ